MKLSLLPSSKPQFAQTAGEIVEFFLDCGSSDCRGDGDAGLNASSGRKKLSVYRKLALFLFRLVRLVSLCGKKTCMQKCIQSPKRSEALKLKWYINVRIKVSAYRQNCFVEYGRFSYGAASWVMNSLTSGLLWQITNPGQWRTAAYCLGLCCPLGAPVAFDAGSQTMRTLLRALPSPSQVVSLLFCNVLAPGEQQVATAGDKLSPGWLLFCGEPGDKCHR